MFDAGIVPVISFQIDTTVMTVTSHVRATPRAAAVRGSERLKVCDVAVAMPMRPTLVSLPSASLLDLDPRGHGEVHLGAAALDPEREGLAGPRRDRLGQLVPRLDRLPVERHDAVAGLEARVRGGHARPHLADHRRHVGVRAPMLQTSAGSLNSVFAVHLARGDGHLLPRAVPRHGQRERAPVGARDRLLDLAPVLDRLAVDGHDPVAGAEPGLRGRGVRRHAADRRAPRAARRRRRTRPRRSPPPGRSSSRVRRRRSAPAPRGASSRRTWPGPSAARRSADGSRPRRSASSPIIFT